MNERIRELTRQAGISILYEYDGYDGHAGVANLADIEKFAELIVRECGNYMNSRIPGNIEVSATVAKMKKHFGVAK